MSRRKPWQGDESLDAARDTAVGEKIAKGRNREFAYRHTDAYGDWKTEDLTSELIRRYQEGDEGRAYLEIKRELRQRKKIAAKQPARQVEPGAPLAPREELCVRWHLLGPNPDQYGRWDYLAALNRVQDEPMTQTAMAQRIPVKQRDISNHLKRAATKLGTTSAELPSMAQKAISDALNSRPLDAAGLRFLHTLFPNMQVRRGTTRAC